MDLIQGSSANPSDHFRVLIFPEIIHIQGWKNPHKGLKSQEKTFSDSTEAWRGWGRGSRNQTAEQLIQKLQEAFKSRKLTICQAYNV